MYLDELSRKPRQNTYLQVWGIQAGTGQNRYHPQNHQSGQFRLGMRTVSPSRTPGRSLRHRIGQSTQMHSGQHAPSLPGVGKWAKCCMLDQISGQHSHSQDNCQDTLIYAGVSTPKKSGDEYDSEVYPYMVYPPIQARTTPGCAAPVAPVMALLWKSAAPIRPVPSSHSEPMVIFQDVFNGDPHVGSLLETPFRIAGYALCLLGRHPQQPNLQTKQESSSGPSHTKPIGAGD